MIKVCFYGAESTGKSTMAARIAAHYQTEFVPEVAREVISSNDFDESDIVGIGAEQTRRVYEKSLIANRILICDTDLITTQIYSEQYLGKIPERLLELEAEIHYDKYFLFDIDTPWVADGLRDLGDKRVEMNYKFIEALNQRKIQFTLVQGSWDQRFEIIRAEIDGLLKQ